VQTSRQVTGEPGLEQGGTDAETLEGLDAA
jgi:hypothetical protein